MTTYAIRPRSFNAVSETRHGPMIHNRLDRYIGQSLARYGEYGEHEGRFLRGLVHQGATVIDAGANVGVFTVQLARHVGAGGHVVAFEPQRLTHQALCGNVALNSLANVTTVHAAVGARAGRLMVPMLDPYRANNIGGLSLGDWDRGEPVPVVPLDALGLDSCALIKIDVEGMELDALTGAEGLIAATRPALYLENDRREKSPAVLSWLFEHGYRAWWHLPPLFNPDNHRGVTENVFGAIRSINVLALPREAGREPGLSEIVAADDWHS